MKFRPQVESLGERINPSDISPVPSLVPTPVIVDTGSPPNNTQSPATPVSASDGTYIVPPTKDVMIAILIEQLRLATNKVIASAGQIAASVRTALTDLNDLALAQAETTWVEADLRARGFNAAQIAADPGYKKARADELAAETKSNASQAASAKAAKDGADAQAEMLDLQNRLAKLLKGDSLNDVSASQHADGAN